MKIAVIFALAAGAVLAGTPSTGTVPQTNVTMDSRACQPPFDTFPFCDTTLPIADRVNDLISRLHDSEIPPFLTARHGGGGSPGPNSNVSRLGVPEFDWGLNCIHGVQSSCVKAYDGTTYCPTSFPNPINYGFTFNTSLFNDLGHIIGVETRALWLAGAVEYSTWSGRPHIGPTCWSPNININRDPRWGRNQEVPSEDPFLNGLFGVGYTQGIQLGPDSDYIQVVSTLKHWDAYSLEDSDGFTRHTFNAIVDNFTLADTYWPAFKASVMEGGARGVMCSYNELNNIPTCGHPFLNQTLRGVWGFDGYVTSDSDAIGDIYATHHYVQTGEEASCVGLAAGGCDIDSGATYHDHVFPALAQGLCNRSDLDRALFNSLKIRFELGLFDPIENQENWHVPLTAVNTTASRENSMLATLESMVLLANENNSLPLPKGKHVAVIGPHANAQSAMAGNYLGQICPEDGFACIVSPAQAIAQLNAGGTVTVAQGCNITDNSTAGFAAAVAAAKAADIVVLFMGIDESVEAEEHDRVTIDLPSVQYALIASIKAVIGSKPLVLVLLNGGMLAVPATTAPAILEAGYPGVFGGTAIAMTLFGENDHLGGKLSYTVYPADYINQIKMSDMSMTDGPGRSYRYYTGVPLFPFGFGLSLTQFTMAPLHVPESTTWSTSVAAAAPGTQASPQLLLSVGITNTGPRTGDEVVMMFVEPLETELTGHPLKRKLVGFERVHLAPGAAKTVSLTLSPRHLQMVELGSGSEVQVAGQFKIVITNNAALTVTTVVNVVGPKVLVTPFPGGPN